MLAINAAVAIGVLFYKLSRPPYVPYIHLLVDYHFGFTKRALIGAIVSLFTAKVPVWLAFALGVGIWLVTLGLFIMVFRRTFGRSEAALPLFAFMAGSPFFFKNFMHTLGHFDIYGCAFALGLLLVPARSILFVMLAALSAMILVLIHHIHLLMYVPTIAAIVVLRHYLVAGFQRTSTVIGAASVLGVGLLFAAAQFDGTMSVPPETFVQYLQGRMLDPARTDLLAFSYIWYQPLSKEIQDTWERLPWNLLGIPVYVALMALHAPLWRYFAASIRALAQQRHRRVAVAALLMVTVGYLVIFATVFDYSRWVSNWVVCLFLILHAVKTLPASHEVPLVPADDRTASVLGWIVTIVPRVGIVRPF